MDRSSGSVRLARCLVVVTGVLVAAAIAIGIAAWSTRRAPATEIRDGIMLLPAAAGFPAIGWLLASRRSENPIGWLFLVAGLLSSSALFAESYGEYGLVARPGSLPAAEWVVWTQYLGFAAFVLPAVFVLLLFPDGRPPSPRWWPFAWVGAGGGVVAIVAASLRPGSLRDFTSVAVPNPAGIEAAGSVLQVLEIIGSSAVGLAVVAAVASLMVRYRRAGDRQRNQLKLLGVAAGALIALSLTGSLLTGGRLIDHAVLSVLTDTMLQVGIPAAIAVAILRHGLYDMEQLVRRTVVYGVLWLAIIVGYIGVAWAMGRVASDRFPVELAVLLTVVVTVVFEPTRRRLNDIAERWVFGRRPTSYELAAEIGAAVEDTDDLAALARRLAELVGRAVDVPWTRVRLSHAGGHQVVGRFPERAPTSEDARSDVWVVPIVHRGEPIGCIDGGARERRGFRESDRRVIELLAREAALAAHGMRLSASLAIQVDMVREQARELAASRSRIVAAQESERRRIERNIHDGAQQELVAMIAKLRLARDQLSSHPERAGRAMEELQADVARVLRDIRELAQGIHPSALDGQGLVQATVDRAARLPLDVRVNADSVTRSRRYHEAVEGTAFFVVSEALANVLKHAGATQAVVDIAQCNGDLVVEIRDDGRGFHPGAFADASHTGIAALADRVDTLGGELVVDSQPGEGTRLRACMPITSQETVDGP